MKTLYYLEIGVEGLKKPAERINQYGRTFQEQTLLSLTFVGPCILTLKSLN